MLSLAALPVTIGTFIGRTIFPKSKYGDNDFGKLARELDQKIELLKKERLTKRILHYPALSNAWFATMTLSHLVRPDPVRQAQKINDTADTIHKKLDTIAVELRQLNENFEMQYRLLERSLQNLETVSQEQKNCLQDGCDVLKTYQAAFQSTINNKEIIENPYLRDKGTFQNSQKKNEEWLKKISDIQTAIDHKRIS